MSFEPVNVYVIDTTPSALPVEGVLVKVYDSTGTSLITQGTTGSDGLVGFLLEAGYDRQLRFAKFGVAIKSPLLIEVLEAPELNAFEVEGELLTVPVATNPRFCRASGYFLTSAGTPHTYLDMSFIPKFDPVILEGRGVVHERVTIRTDSNGFAQIDLIRFAKYSVQMEGYEDSLRCIAIPDSSSVNLPDLLFPVVSRVTFDPSGPYSLGVGDTLEIVPTVYASDGNTISGAASEDVLWSTSDKDVAVVEVSQTKLTLRGVGTGVATLDVVRLDNSIVRIPEPGITGRGVAITVT